MSKKDFIGLESLTMEITNRRTRAGLAFNVMVVGPTGIGKTTLINSLFNLDYGDTPNYERKYDNVVLHIKEFRPPNKTINMRLTIIETKGLGDHLDNSKSYKSVIDYINDRYQDHLDNLVKVQTNKYNDIADNRVHCCIYMMSPTIGAGLSPIDLMMMKQLHKRVCLIPVIGKADVLTKQAKNSLIERIRQEITLNGIQIYSSGDYHLPMAVSGSNELVNDNGQRRRIRTYPWGVMNIELHSDFPRLRDLILRKNMLSLIETTDRVHYDDFRKEAVA